MEYIILSIVVILFFIGFYSTNYPLQMFMHSLIGKFIVVSVLASLSYIYGIRTAVVSSILILLYYNYGTMEGFSNQDQEAVEDTDEDSPIDDSDSETTDETEPNTASSTSNGTGSSMQGQNSSSDIQNIKGQQQLQELQIEKLNAELQSLQGLVKQSGANGDIIDNDPKDPSNYKNSVNPDDDSPMTYTQSSNGSNETKEVLPMPSKTTEGFSLLY